MIYALYGSDTYRSRKKMNQIIDAYRQKAGASIDLHRFDSNLDDCAELKSMMKAQSLFTPKKLVVVENALDGAMVDMKGYAKQWKEAKDQHLFFMHGALDASARKHLKSWEPMLAQSQEFDELAGAKKEAWIRTEAAERGVALSSDQLRALCAAPDSWFVVQEIEKIAVGGVGENRTSVRGKPTVFDFGDTFFTDKRRALGILHLLLENGEDEFGLFSYLANRSRALVAVKQCAQEKRQIPSWLGIHPFVAKKTEALVRLLTLAQCGAFVTRFFEEDWRIKVGLSQPKDSLVGMLME